MRSCQLAENRCRIHSNAWPNCRGATQPRCTSILHGSVHLRPCFEEMYGHEIEILQIAWVRAVLTSQSGLLGQKCCGGSGLAWAGIHCSKANAAQAQRLCVCLWPCVYSGRLVLMPRLLGACTQSMLYCRSCCWCCTAAAIARGLCTYVTSHVHAALGWERELGEAVPLGSKQLAAMGL